jgi:hypothetical protein
MCAFEESSTTIQKPVNDRDCVDAINVLSEGLTKINYNIFFIRVELIFQKYKRDAIAAIDAPREVIKEVFESGPFSYSTPRNYRNLNFFVNNYVLSPLKSKGSANLQDLEYVFLASLWSFRLTQSPDGIYRCRKMCTRNLHLNSLVFTRQTAAKLKLEAQEIERSLK